MESLWKGICRPAAIAGMVLASVSFARADVPDEVYLWKFSASAGLNSDGWEWDAGISFVPYDYVSVKLAVGLAGELHPISDWDLCWVWDDDPYMDYDDSGGDYAARVKLMPSIEFKTPALLRWEQTDGTFHLFVNPGVVLSPGASGSHGADWCTWQVRGGVELDIYRVGLQIGYGYSTFSLYSGSPYTDSGYYDRPAGHTHSVFASLSYQF